MIFKLGTKHALVAASLIMAPGVALAQNQVEAQANKVAAEAKDLQQATNTLSATVQNQDGDATAARHDGDDRDRHHDRDDDGDSGKWGLLGLLGLAGLLGLRRRDHDHHHHVDRDYDRTTTTAGTTRTSRGTDAGTDTRL